jgi:hypothetical protein
MEEDKGNAQGNHEAHGELIDAEKAHGNGSVVGKLIVQQLLIDEPSYKQTGEESAQQQHDLCRDVIAEIKQ